MSAASRPVRFLDSVRARFEASDPGRQALKRAARATISFLLTLLSIWLVGRVTGRPIMTMALGFPISIFAPVLVQNIKRRDQLASIAVLAAAAALSFTASSLIKTSWLNHGLFAALIFAAIYARRWGSPWTAAGFGAFVSFFFGAFLQPELAALPWHMAGLGLAAVSAFLVPAFVIPRRPAAELPNVLMAIRREVALVLEEILNDSAGQNRSSIQRQLGKLRDAITRARADLEASGQEADNSYLGFHLFEVETAAERLVRQIVMNDGEASKARPSLDALHDHLIGRRAHPSLPTPTGRVEQAICALDRALQRLSQPPDRQNQSYPNETDADGPEDKTQDQKHLRVHTRIAAQAAGAAILAMIGGEMLSHDRWYWAVITVFVVFSRTQSRGEVLLKTLRRIAGTVLGVLAGIGIVWLAGDAHALKLGLLPVAVFLTFYFFNERYSVMIFFLTILLALLYSLTGQFTPSLLWLRLGETAIGGLSSLLAAAVLLPRATHKQATDHFTEMLDASETLVKESVIGLLEGGNRSLRAPVRAFASVYNDLGDAVRPLRLDTVRRGKDLQAMLTDNLQACSYWLHELALAGDRADRPVTSGKRIALCSTRDRVLDQIRETRRKVEQSIPTARTLPDIKKDNDFSVGGSPYDAAIQAMTHASDALARTGDALLSGRRENKRFNLVGSALEGK